MAHNHQPHQSQPRPRPSAGEILNYRVLANRRSTQQTSLTNYLNNYQPTHPAAAFAFPYILCGIWIGMSFMLVTIGTTIVLSTFYAIVNARSFPNIQAFHQVASSNGHTFKVIIVMYIFSVCALFVANQGPGMAFEEYWWVCMQVFCGVQVVFFASMVFVWSIPQVVGLVVWVFRLLAWVFRRMFQRR